MKNGKKQKRYSGYLEIDGHPTKRYRICDVFITHEALVLSTVTPIG
ncbi:hypothetical protein [Sediminicola sp. 1XM1-17]